MSADRRLRYTKMFLRESLLKLLEHKALSRITVKEICEDADINRSTYYTYYTDPLAQFHELEQNLFDDLTAYIEESAFLTSDTDLDQNSHRVLYEVLHYMEEHKKDFRVLISRSENYCLWKNVLHLFDEKIFTEVRIETDLTMELQLQYVYATAGCLGLIEHWLMTPSNLTAEDIASKIDSLNNHIFP